MNKFYVFVCLIASFQLGFSQLIPVEPPFTPKSKHFGKFYPSEKASKSTACGIDTLYYSRYNLGTGSFTQYINFSSTRGGGMFFACEDTLLLHGFNYYAYTSNLQNQIVTCKVFAANANSLPTGSALATATDTIIYKFIAPNFLSRYLQKVKFSTPVQITGDYVITVEFPNSNNVIMLTNDYNNNDGLGLDYTCIRLFNNQNSSWYWTNSLVLQTTPPTPFDADVYFEPAVEYKMKAQFEEGPNSCLGNGEIFDFVNTSTFILNPQYSREARDTTLEDNFLWDYGDGSAYDTAINGSHLYTGTFGYTPILVGEFDTWTGNTCLDSGSLEIERGTVSALFTHTVNDKSVTFQDKSTDAMTYRWDFGDGTGSIQPNPVHNYPAYNTYFVKQKVRNRGCVDSTTRIVKVVDYTGISSLDEEADIEIGPIPAIDVLVIRTGLPEAEQGQWTLFNTQGSIVDRGIYSRYTELNVSGYDSGVYFMRFVYGNATKTRRLVIR